LPALRGSAQASATPQATATVGIGPSFSANAMTQQSLAEIYFAQGDRAKAEATNNRTTKRGEGEGVRRLNGFNDLAVFGT